jgi:molecular chaperone HscC
MDKIIGIDLGTTNSAAALLDDGGPRILPNAVGESLTPSVVGIEEDGNLLVGRAAKELQVLHPERCASVFKRHMGSDWTATLVGRKFTPEELSSLVLRTIKKDVEAHLGHKVERAVITVPAYFNDQQRKATLNAGHIAGWKVERIFNEPTAAALAYGFHESKEDKVLLIFDLGGGTFDVSVVEFFDGVLEVKSSSGETFLGGEDFTRTLAARILDSHGFPFERTELDSPLLVARMLQQCEVAKCKLSRQESITMRLPDRKGNLAENAANISVTRQQFQAWTNHILGRVEMPLRRVLGDAGLKKQDVNEVILVGGATRMPAVMDFVTQYFGKRPHCRLNPDEAVALGAAVQAGLLGKDQSVEDMVVTDVAPFTLGIETSKKFGSDLRNGYFFPIIHRNTTLPVSRVERVGTLEPNQTEIIVKIYQGESRRVESNLFLGEFKVQGIPRGPAGQGLDIRFTYDLNGVLEVEATIVETRKKFTHLVTRYARSMSRDDLARAIKAMEAIKTHPREEAVNRLLLRRAERMYQELALDLREQLSMLLDGFEMALSMQDVALIERHRQALEMFLNAYDTSTEPDNDDVEDENA